MTDIFANSASFLLTILLANFLKQKGLFKQEDGQVLTKVILYFTLPATIIVGVNHTRLSSLLFILAGVGILLNLILIFCGQLLGRNKSREEQGIYMFMLGGFNIGNFAIPFVGTIIPHAIPLLGMFDMGNAFMVSGGTIAIVDNLTNQKGKTPPMADVFRRLLKNPPFTTYLFMFLLAAIQVSIPEVILTPLRFFASANSFLSMFMIGLFMNLELHDEGKATVKRLLIAKYGIAILLSAVIYLFIPMDIFVKQVLVLILLSPIANLGMINAIEFGSDKGVAGLSGSFSMIISLVLMSIAGIFFG